MKYYELMRSAVNPAGADFAYCTEDELEKVKEEFEPTYPVTEISEEEYKKNLEIQNRRFLRLVTGYPK